MRAFSEFMYKNMWIGKKRIDLRGECRRDWEVDLGSIEFFFYIYYTSIHLFILPNWLIKLHSTKEYLAVHLF